MDIIVWFLCVAVLALVGIVVALCAAMCCFLLQQLSDCGMDMPKVGVNPVKAIKEHKEQKEAQKEAEREQKRIDAILRNIDNYDGTGYGQEDV